MARRSSSNGSVPRTVPVVPSKAEADAIVGQVGSLLVVEQHLQQVIDTDVNTLNTVDSPFVHPLYPLIIKVSAIRGKAAKKLAMYARFEKKQAAEARKLAAANA